MNERTLGTHGPRVSALGLGCWAIGGPFRHDGWVGYGDVDDAESVRAIQRALDLGVTLFDTADAYGCGHSERVLGRALKGRRDGVRIATKVGWTFDETTRAITGADVSPAHIRAACEASLRRLGTDVIDVYQLHVSEFAARDPGKALAAREAFEDLVADGLIRGYTWSTDNPAEVELFAGGAHCLGVQNAMNLFFPADDVREVCERRGLVSLNRGPLGMGLLTGKYTKGSRLPENDMRHGWDLSDGERAERLDRLEELRGALTADGRSLAQGALGWIWARSERCVPIPGFKTVAQVEENAGALRFGALPQGAYEEVERLLGRAVEVA